MLAIYDLGRGDLSEEIPAETGKTCGQRPRRVAQGHAHGGAKTNCEEGDLPIAAFDLGKDFSPRPWCLKSIVVEGHPDLVLSLCWRTISTTPESSMVKAYRFCLLLPRLDLAGVSRDFAFSRLCGPRPGILWLTTDNNRSRCGCCRLQTVNDLNKYLGPAVSGPYSVISIHQ